MTKLVHILKIESAPSGFLSAMSVVDGESCIIPAVHFTEIEIHDVVGVKISDEYENNQKIYTTTATFRTARKTPVAMRRQVFRLTSMDGKRFLLGTSDRPYPVVKEENPFPEKPVDGMLKTVTITWKSVLPLLSIIK